MTARDGTRLVCWDFGGQGRPLLMVHGTGLHGRCWAPVARPLSSAGFRPLALDMRGHGASGRSPDGDYNWDLFALDVLETLAQLGLANGTGGAGGGAGAGGAGAGGAGAPAPGVVAVGHSAGGSAVLLAEASRQGSFSRIWAWEPIMSIPGSDDRARRGTELARRSRQRRGEFASIDEARAHFQGRHMFAEFSPAALEAFLDGGLVPNDAGGYKLACGPEDEARVYEGAASHDAWEGLARVHCPTRLLGGELSPAVPPDELATIAAQLPAQVPTGKGPTTATIPMLGHFGPFQSPADIASDIANWAS
ncbi:MAG TPA: alpha/beta hydrolase [Acidimicrobiales bacterium]|nr:alpha/beta hydrolase [Acidimicrobiales bacterium]